MAAEAAVSSAVQMLGNLLIQKVGFLRGVEGQVKRLKDELKRMQCFLKDAAEKDAQDERVRNWISEIREVAQDAEDAIEIFILKVENTRRSRALLGRCASFPNHLYRLNKVGEEIDSIRARLQDIESSRIRYGIKDLGEGAQSTKGSENVAEHRRLSPWQKDKHVVGLDKDVELLLEKAILDERELGLSIATIVGMGGIGKSTLARIVYNHAAVADRFDRRAWVVVSREFNPKEIMKELMLQVLEPTEDKLKVLEIMKELTMQSLQQMLHERLQGRRFFIVVDDVWENAHWESLRNAFPDEQDKASRLLLTSRSRDIPKYARYVHEMKPLEPYDSWKLFLSKAVIGTDNECPQELEYIGREILKRCAGLPLAITVVGGLLVNQRQSKGEWEKILKGINSNSGRSTSIVSTILELSYGDLPPKLKACFLCLGFFKEDATIRAQKLVHIWIAQGFVPGDGEEGTMEEIARGYLDELINRNIVQVKDTNKDDQVKDCYIHDLLRELSIAKAKEEISFEILREEGSSSKSLDKARHCAIYNCREMFTANQNKHVRSLFIHEDDVFFVSSSYWKSFELLRILDLEDVRLRKLPHTIGALIGLRYLGLRNTGLRELPRSLGHLKNLEVLDIAKNHKLRVPNIIWKMDSLRHLYTSIIWFKGPLNMGTLKKIQSLMYIPDSICIPEHITHMTNLRKLGIRLSPFSDVKELFNSMAKLENLVYLKLCIGSRRLSSIDGLDSLHGITQLKLYGGLTRLPDLPPNLSYLSLVQTFLKEDPMPVLENLLKLLYLKLDHAYTGSKMVISDDRFPRLNVLALLWMSDLRNIEVGKDGMKELKRLETYECPNLEGNDLPEQVRSVMISQKS